MTEISEIIDLKITELKEEIEKGNSERESSKFFKLVRIYDWILLISTLIAFIALLYAAFAVRENDKSVNLQVVIMIAYIGISLIPRFFFYGLEKKTRRISKLTLKLGGFEWLKTRSPDQQENILKIMKNRGLI